MNEIIYKGLRLVTDKCRYFNVKEGKINSLEENDSVLTLTYSPGSSAKSLSMSLGIKLVGPGRELMEPTRKTIKFKKTYVTLNGLRLEKLTYDPHTINIVIVRDSNSRVVQSYGYTIFIVNYEDYRNPEFINYLFYSGQLLYLRPVGKKIRGYELRNFPKIIVKDRDLDLTSTNDVLYTLRKRYDDYLIREIDYQDQFILEIRKILDEYGIEFVRLNKETTLSTTSYVTYQFTQTPVLSNHPFSGDPDRNIMQYKQPVEFTLHTTDMVLYHDFKSKYTDLLLLTNFCEYKTPDRAGDKWTAAIKWGPITEDFNHIYQPDDNSNFAFQCQFRCELYYYNVLDTRYKFLKEIISRIDSEDIDGSNPIEEEKTIKNDNVQEEN